MCLSEASCLGLPRRWRREIGSIETSRSSFRRRSSMIMSASRARSPHTSGNRGGVRPNFRTLLIRWVRYSLVLGTSLQVAAARRLQALRAVVNRARTHIPAASCPSRRFANCGKVVAQNQRLRPFYVCQNKTKCGSSWTGSLPAGSSEIVRGTGISFGTPLSAH